MRVLMKAACCAALAMVLAAPASADTWNKKTFLTFSGPVQVPGVTLPAGTYTFKLEITDKDGATGTATMQVLP